MKVEPALIKVVTKSTQVIPGMLLTRGRAISCSVLLCSWVRRGLRHLLLAPELPGV